MRYHDLRHGAASLMAAQGIPARVAMEILGHAQMSTMLNIYTHVAPKLQKEATELVAKALWPTVPSGLVSELVSTSPQYRVNGLK
jgi:integrase